MSGEEVGGDEPPVGGAEAEVIGGGDLPEISVSVAAVEPEDRKNSSGSLGSVPSSDGRAADDGGGGE